MAVLGIVAAIFFLLRRRKQKNALAGDATIRNHGADKGGTMDAETVPVVEAPTKDTGAQEVEGFTPILPQTSPSELDATNSFLHSSQSGYPMLSPTLGESAVSPYSPDGAIVGHQHESKKG